LNSEKDQLERKVEREHRTALALKQALEDSKTPLAVALAESEGLQKELLTHRKHEESLAKQADVIEREKNLQIRATQRAEAKTKEQEDFVKEQERITFHLTSEVQGYKDEVQRLHKIVYKLENDRERLGNEVGEQRNQHLSSLEEVKLRDVHIIDFLLQLYDVHIT